MSNCFEGGSEGEAPGPAGDGPGVCRAAGSPAGGTQGRRPPRLRRGRGGGGRRDNCGLGVATFPPTRPSLDG